MELNSVNPTSSVSVPPVVKKTVAQTSENATDSVNISEGAVSAAQLVEIVRQAPEARTELVARLKSQVSKGNYPPPYIIEGLARLMGIVKDDTESKN